MFAYVPEIHNDDDDDCSIPLENYEYDVVEDDNDDVVCVCVPWQPCALLTYATTGNRNNGKKVPPKAALSVCVHAIPKCTFEICTLVAKPSLIHIPLV